MLELEALEAELKPFTDKFFGTFFEVGYIFENSDLLEPGWLFKYAVEYRQSPANNFLIRFNLDQYGLRYHVNNDNPLIGDMQGATDVTDVLLGPGYRFGEGSVRLFLLAQVGLKYYSFPTASPEPPISFVEVASSQGMYRFAAGIEYYFDDTFAATVDVFHQRVFNAVDYWTEEQGATCISVGLIGSFF